MATTATEWTVAVGADITAAIDDPPGEFGPGVTLGARVEMPYTRAIVSYYQRATQDPQTRVWTVTLEGVPFTGMFQFVWRTDDAEPPEYEVMLPILVSASALPAGGLQPVYGQNYPPVDRGAVTPTVAGVSKLERTRTVDDAGNEYEVFNDQTRPTAQEVEGIIGDAVDFVLSTLPEAFNPARYEQVRRVVALNAAMTIEGSFFKEQSAPNMPVRWQPEYTGERDKLEESILEDRNQNNLLGAMEPRLTAPTTTPTGLA